MTVSYQTMNASASENALLSTVLSKNSLLLDIDLAPNDFAGQANSLIFQTMQDLYKAGVPVDLVTLTNKLQDMGKLEDAGGIEAITRLGALDAPSSKAKAYADIIRNYSQRRQLYQACREIADEAVSGEKDLEQIINGGLMKISQVGERKGKNNELTDAFDLMATATDRILTGVSTGLRTGYRSLDRQLPYGLRAGELIILAGRPSMGKTALAINLVLNTLQQNKKVLFFSLETGVESIGQRLLQAHARISQSEILMASAGGAVVDRVINGANWFTSKKEFLKVNTGGYHTPESISAISRKEKLKGGLDLVIIDHLQLISAEGFKNNRLAEITYISRKLKQLAKDIDCPVLVLSQLSRAVENRDDRHPRMSDLRESGSIEQDADIIMMLYRDGYYHAENDDGTVEVIISKQKDGPIGTVRLNYLKEYMKFMDTSNGYIEGKDLNSMEIPL